MFTNGSAAVRRAVTTGLDLERARRSRDPERLAQASAFDSLAILAVPLAERHDLAVGLTLAYEYELENNLV